MKIPAIIASVTVAGSLAFAAGHQNGEGQPRGVSGRSQLRPDPVAPRRVAASTANCPAGNLLLWFSQVPHAIPCANGSDSQPFLTAPDLFKGAADINGDGVLEHFGAPPPGGTSGAVILSGTPTGAALSIWTSQVDSLSGAPTTIRDYVPIVPVTLGAWVQSVSPGVTDAYIHLYFGSGPTQIESAAGFRDMDGDGDLDYLAILELSGTAGDSSQQIWFENIGFEKAAPPVAADLNRDGQVDGADLGMLLFAWGPNP